MFPFTFYIYFHISFANVYSYDVRVSSSSAICVCWCCFFTFAKHVTRYNALPAICVKCKSGTNRDWVTRSENCFAEVMTEQKSCRFLRIAHKLPAHYVVHGCIDVTYIPTDTHFSFVRDSYSFVNEIHLSTINIICVWKHKVINVIYLIQLLFL